MRPQLSTPPFSTCSTQPCSIQPSSPLSIAPHPTSRRVLTSLILVLPLLALPLITGCGGGGGGGGAPATIDTGLDPNFGDGTGGARISNAFISSQTVDTLDRIVTVGSDITGPNQDVIVARILPDGSFDTTFGTTGAVVFSSLAGVDGVDRADGVAVDSVGRILITGTTFAGIDFDLFVMRLTATGNLDTSFGIGGIFLFDDPLFNIGDSGTSIIVDGLNRAVVAGISRSTSQAISYVLRLDSTGSLDASFGSGGIEDLTGSTTETVALRARFDSVGRILLAGSDGIAAAIWRLGSGGLTDTTFGSNGVFLDISGDSQAQDVVAAPDGTVVACGFLGFDLTLWRVTDGGAPDTTFGVNGRISANVVDSNGNALTSLGSALQVDSSGRFVVSGVSIQGPLVSPLMWRFLDDGTPDIDFRGDGFQSFSSESSAEALALVSLNSTGEILLGSTTLFQGLPEISVFRVLQSE